VALQSIHRYAGTCRTDIVDLPPATTDPRAHGAAIDEWRRDQAGQVQDTDTVVIMDPDVALLSEWWRRELDHVLLDENPGNVGIWGAGSAEDFGPRVHASMMAIRGRLWNFSQATFLPIGTGPWRDTGGFYCEQAVNLGWKVKPVERGKDWKWEYSAWYPTPLNEGGAPFYGMGPSHVCENCGAPWHRECGACAAEWDHPCRLTPMWTHLGGGSHSDPARMTWLQRIKRWKAVQQREEFKRLVREHLSA
jgi:hypothetical protein